MNRLEFEAAVAAFKRDVIQNNHWDTLKHRYHEEYTDHKRFYELSVWWGTGESEVGVVFTANCVTWKGVVDWRRIREIVAAQEGFIKFNEPSNMIWNLADLTQPAPRRI